jgi:hypothetical protein
LVRYKDEKYVEPTKGANLDYRKRDLDFGKIGSLKSTDVFIIQL